MGSREGVPALDDALGDLPGRQVEAGNIVREKFFESYIQGLSSSGQEAP